jgi:hypothetical protein
MLHPKFVDDSKHNYTLQLTHQRHITSGCGSELRFPRRVGSGSFLLQQLLKFITLKTAGGQFYFSLM